MSDATDELPSSSLPSSTPSATPPLNSSLQTAGDGIGSTSESGGQSGVNNPTANTGGGEEIVAKYKRLLSLARSSLEANQATLAAKDAQLASLSAALEEERAAHRKTAASRGTASVGSNSLNRDEEGGPVPRRILARVQLENSSNAANGEWVAIQFDSGGNLSDEWRYFPDIAALEDWVRLLPGPPLTIPPPLLSAAASSAASKEGNERADRLAEEFRRYRVRMELSLRQATQDAQHRPAAALSAALVSSSAASSSAVNSPTGTTSGAGLSATLEKAMSLGSMADSSAAVTGGSSSQEEVSRLRHALAENEAKWRSAYDKLRKEMETLREQNNEAAVAAGWRARYEACLRDKEEVAARLALYTQLTDTLGAEGRSLEEFHLDLQEEYKSLRKRLQELVDEYRHRSQRSGADEARAAVELVTELCRLLTLYSVDTLDLDDTRPLTRRQGPGATSAANQGGAHGTAGNTAESKAAYLRAMVFQYLVCPDREVKRGIEAALVTLLRFSPAEKLAYEKVHGTSASANPLSSISSYFG